MKFVVRKLAHFLKDHIHLRRNVVTLRTEYRDPSEWKEQLPGVMFFSATYHDAETAKRITDKHHFTWTHLIEAKDMMAWIGYEGFPLTIVVDKKGIVRHAVHGTNETKREELLAKIKEAEAE